jgi:hypothetical protein
VINLLVLAIFLFQNHQTSLAIKIQQIAQSIFSCTGGDLLTATIQATIDTLVDYVQSRPPPSLLPPLLPSTQLVPNFNEKVNNIISLLSQFLPHGEHYLLSAQDLYVFYNTLSTFLPPFPSPLDIVAEQTCIAYTSSESPPQTYSPTSPSKPPMPEASPIFYSENDVLYTTDALSTLQHKIILETNLTSSSSPPSTPNTSSLPSPFFTPENYVVSKSRVLSFLYFVF